MPMTAPRGTVDVPAASRAPLSSPDYSAISSRPTPTSTHSTMASPAPVTPHRGRYPDSLGRVPLHRRGTSNTYERLEDLLREAGYKETRVFTPDADRNGRTTTENGGMGNSVRESVGAVVGFITGLVSRGSSMSREPAPLEDSSEQSPLHLWSSPPSPLAHTAHLDPNSTRGVSSVASLSRNDSSESMLHRTYVDLSAGASPRTHTHQVMQLHQSSQGLPHHPHLHPRPYHDQHLNRRQLNNYSSKSSSTKQFPPNARTYLRHMASAPNIQPLIKRPSLPDASLMSHTLRRDHRDGTRSTFILNDEDNITECDHESPSRVTIDDHERQVHPPLPRNWMESVAKALLSSVGAPAVPSDAASTRTTKTASTRKSSALSDKSNREERGRTPTRVTKPPFLCVQMQDAKARSSEGQVACTRVMCRSTPTSRASSRAPNAARDDRTKARNGGKRREVDKPRNRWRGKDRDAAVVPSLARMKVENDGWMAPRQRYSGGWGTEGGSQAYPNGMWSDDSDGDDHNDDDDDDEDEEGELGLDRLLVPARRQHSIQSLRKHLHRPSSQLFGGRGVSRPRSPRSGRTSPFGGAPTGRLGWGNASWSTSRGQGWLTNQGGEGEDGYVHVLSSEARMARSSTKWRRGLPSLAQWTTSS